MKKQDYNELEIVDEGVFEGIDASIDETNVAFLYDIISSQIYKNPIGSFIREITSNCFDSHVEAKVLDKAVLITFATDEDSGQEFIAFQDFGIGISEERMRTIYSKYLSSSKRDSDDFIGMFGLGSKSPLAYTDNFFLTTVFDGIKYEYLVHKGKKQPRIEILDTYDTDEENGTEVKIHLKSRHDISTVNEELKKQLRYFDNVYVAGNLSTVNNDYDIKEGKHFKYKVQSEYGNRFFSREMHLCIEKVVYPIDWNEMQMAPINIPVGLKFSIGDLVVTPERESVRYVAFKKEGEDGTILELETKDVIRKKIELVKDELVTSYLQQGMETSDFIDWYSCRAKSTLLYLIDDKDTVDDYDEELTYAQITQSCPSLDIDEILSDRVVFRVFTPFKWCENVNIPVDIFFNFKVIGTLTVDNKLIREGNFPDNISSLVTRHHWLIRFPANQESTPKLNEYHNYLRSLDSPNNTTYFIRPKKLLKGNFNYIFKSLFGITSNKNCIQKTGLNYREFWKKWKRTTKKLLILYSHKYEIEIEESWNNDYETKKKQRRDKLKRDRENKVILNRVSYTEPKKDWNQKVEISKIQNFKSYIIYSTKEDESVLVELSKLFSRTCYDSTVSSELYWRRLNFIYLAPSNFKYLEKIENAMPLEEFMKGDTEPFRNAVTVELLKKKIEVPLKNYKGTKHVFEFLFPPYVEEIEEIQKLEKRYSLYYTKNSDEGIMTSMFAVAAQNNLFDMDLLKRGNKLKNYYEKVGLVSYLRTLSYDYREVKQFILDYIDLNLALIHYFRICAPKVNTLLENLYPYELELIQQSLEKEEYSYSVYKGIVKDSYEIYQRFYYEGGEPKNQYFPNHGFNKGITELTRKTVGTSRIYNSDILEGIKERLINILNLTLILINHDSSKKEDYTSRVTQIV